MRIVSGVYGGRKLAALGKGDAAAHLRPTSDRVRESLFSMLAHHDVLDGAQVLDLFAGTGALGLEALSRGGARVTFVENGRKSLSLIRENVQLLGVQDRCRTLQADATRLRKNDTAPYDLIFLDPPYGKGLGERALAAALTNGWVADNAMIVWEEQGEMAAPKGFARADSRRYGDTWVTILVREGSG